ncbi:hypothetical protein [Sphingobacterium phlebotomi]|uniref:hypothetical protein n=1 Tax=Sphingobacterium phlebotomi TaxID=2605433 RepID=UPI0016535180|nr:hypothetical protein [Sphingobacterium phlebotomi]
MATENGNTEIRLMLAIPTMNTKNIWRREFNKITYPARPTSCGISERLLKK